MAKKQQDNSDSFLESGELSLIDDSSEGIDSTVSAKPKEGRFLGMTPPQRFVIAMILFLMVCVLGAFCLVLSGKVWIAF